MSRIGQVNVVHDLKCDYNYLKRLVMGFKTAEVRYNDRDYQLGDYLSFELPPDLQGSLETRSKRVLFRITHVHSGLGLKEGYVMLSLSLDTWSLLNPVDD